MSEFWDNPQKNEPLPRYPATAPFERKPFQINKGTSVEWNEFGNETANNVVATTAPEPVPTTYTAQQLGLNPTKRTLTIIRKPSGQCNCVREPCFCSPGKQDPLPPATTNGTTQTTSATTDDDKIFGINKKTLLIIGGVCVGGYFLSTLEGKK